MKKILLLVATALLAVAMVSCEKDKENGGNNNSGNQGNNPAPAVDSTNMSSVGGVVATLTANLSFDDFGEASFGAANGSRSIHFSAGLAWESIGRVIDLTTAPSDVNYWFRYENLSNGKAFTQRNYEGEIYADIDQDEASSEVIFSSGTLTTEHISGGYTLTIEGTLTNGTPVLIRLNVSYSGEVIPLTKNSVIYDGVKYELTQHGAAQTPSGMVQWSAANGSTVVATGHIYPGSTNLHAYLHEYPIGDGYHFDFNINMPDLQLDYQWVNDTLICSLNGEEVRNPFTTGDAETYVYDGRMSFFAIGTLTNGKTVKLYVSSNVE